MAFDVRKALEEQVEVQGHLERLKQPALECVARVARTWGSDRPPPEETLASLAEAAAATTVAAELTLFVQYQASRLERRPGQPGGEWPPGLGKALGAALAELETACQTALGEAPVKLAVSVRQRCRAFFLGSVARRAAVDAVYRPVPRGDREATAERRPARQGPAPGEGAQGAAPRVERGSDPAALRRPQGERDANAAAARPVPGEGGEALPGEASETAGDVGDTRRGPAENGAGPSGPSGQPGRRRRRRGRPRPRPEEAS